MCTVKKLFSTCALITWILSTTVAVILGMTSPIRLLVGGRNIIATEELLIMVLCYTYIAYVMYTIDYARMRWNRIKDSVYVPNGFNIVQIATMVAMFTLFVICLIVTWYR